MERDMNGGKGSRGEVLIWLFDKNGRGERAKSKQVLNVQPKKKNIGKSCSGYIW